MTLLTNMLALIFGYKGKKNYLAYGQFWTLCLVTFEISRTLV